MTPLHSGSTCMVPKFIAYPALVYALASIYYLIATRDIGTPFNDSLNQDQRKIKEQASYLRYRIFMTGVLLSTVFLVLSQPL